MRPDLKLLGSAIGVLALVLTGGNWHPAVAAMALDKVIVDFSPAGPSRDDIEITNAGDEILYVSVEPAEIVDPGGPEEKRISNPDPRAMGLLVSPNRLALGPGERKVIRFSLLDRPSETDRIYRVSIKPVVGEISARKSALKILVGYDVLVIARPDGARSVLTAAREGDALLFRNLGNTNALLFDGEQCTAPETDCVELPSKRVYAGRSWRVDLPGDGPVRYFVESSNGTTTETY